ncbi:hypothetical protein BDZ45DRAFT_740476 [Acephala macrosclerotiorum]|nr:hypothetical protein BDZ45DRAFT_740476 [Acephala macrosclerotiorum]
MLGEPTCIVYPWCKTSLFSPIFLYFWAIHVFASLYLCIYTASSAHVNKPFSIHNTCPQTSITSQPGDLLLHLQDLSFNAANDIVLYVFVFRSIPVILASYFAITWFSVVDRSTRFSQPFANIYNKSADANDSILRDYLWGIPGLVTINAFSNGHYKVFWFSLLDLLSPVFPILVDGLFLVTNTGEKIVFTIVHVTFYFVLAYLGIYLLALPIADYVSLFYASHLLNDSNKESPESDGLLEGKTYMLGFYVGVDGRRHWGLERTDLAEVEFVSLKDFWREKEREMVERERIERERLERESEEWEMVEIEVRGVERQRAERTWVEEVGNEARPAMRGAT